MPTVLIYDAIEQAGLDLLAKRPGVSTVTVPANDAGRLMAALPDADAAILRYYHFGKEAIGAGAKLKVIQGLALDAMTRAGEWKARETIPTIELFEKKVLVVGFGRIGSRVAPRCQAFGMEVFVHDPYVSDNAIRAKGFAPVRDLRAVLPEMDFVTLHTPLTEETRHLIDRAAIARMKDGAVLVNTARGEIADNAAVAEALTGGKLFAAGFDVFEPEPPGTGHSLVRHPRTVLTPHAAALTRECNRRTSIRCAQNALDAIDGRLDGSYVVNPEVLRR
jgi:D-3-phosphoglycerate dehydrogenase